MINGANSYRQVNADVLMLSYFTFQESSLREGPLCQCASISMVILSCQHGHGKGMCANVQFYFQPANNNVSDNQMSVADYIKNHALWQSSNEEKHLEMHTVEQAVSMASWCFNSIAFSQMYELDFKKKWNHILRQQSPL